MGRTSQASRSVALRVASAAPRDLAIAATWASNWLMVRPCCLRSEQIAA